MDQTRHTGLTIFLIIVGILLLLIVIGSIVTYYIVHKRHEDPCKHNPNGFDANGNPCTPIRPINQVSCVGLLDMPSCYTCMVPASQRTSTCPNCAMYPQDPSCIDCTIKPRNPMCPSCATYPDAPGCPTNPNQDPTSAEIIKQFQSKWFTVQNGGNCLTVHGDGANANGEIPVEMSQCLANNYNQQWKMDSSTRLIPRSHPTYRLDTVGGHAAAGAKVHIDSINSASDEAWTPMTNPASPNQFSLQNVYNSSVCLDGSAGLGQRVTTEVCNGLLPGQFWNLSQASTMSAL